jgi:hypothetical protein
MVLLSQSQDLEALGEDHKSAYRDLLDNLKHPEIPAACQARKYSTYHLPESRSKTCPFLEGGLIQSRVVARQEISFRARVSR